MKTITLCSRGGGVKSATAIGALLAFKEAKFEIARFSGTSIGAVIMSLAAIGTSEEEIYRLFLKYVVLYSNGSRTRGGGGSSVIEETVNKQCKMARFKDLNMPLYIPANAGGLWNTKPFVFSRETTPDITLGEACRASCSFPILYEHYKTCISGKEYSFFDGGMVLNPYIPSRIEDNVTVVISFLKKKQNMMSRYVNAWLEPEKNADILIKPYIGKMSTLGTPKDIELCTLAGFYETKKYVKTLREF